MNTKSLLIVIFLFQFAQSHAFDFFYLVQQWPGAMSNLKDSDSFCLPSTRPVRSDFGIHGLWPTYNNGLYDTDCKPPRRYDRQMMNRLIGDMQANWPSFRCPSSDGESFWIGQWNKHGTCSTSVFNQLTYFWTAVRRKEGLKTLKSLTDANIKPDGTSYKLVDIKAAIVKKTGFKPEIECNVDEHGNIQLFQVYTCLDKTGTKLIDCLGTGTRGCGQGLAVAFPKF